MGPILGPFWPFQTLELVPQYFNLQKANLQPTHETMKKNFFKSIKSSMRYAVRKLLETKKNKSTEKLSRLLALSKLRMKLHRLGTHSLRSLDPRRFR